MHGSFRPLCRLVTLSLLAGCSGGGSATPSFPDHAVRPTVAQARSEVDSAQAAAARCTPIKNVNPDTDFPNATALRFEGGDHLALDATGCTYGIYLSPKSTDLHVDDVSVVHASRVQIFSEDVSGVAIHRTVVNGVSFDRADPTSVSLGGIAFRGASGTIDRSEVFNANVFGINIVANNRCFGVGLGTCHEPDVTVDRSTVNNSTTPGDGIDVLGGPFPLRAIASISRTTVIGSNSATLLPGQVDLYGQVGFGFIDAAVTVRDVAAVNNQVGFDEYCAKGIEDIGDLIEHHDRVSFATPIVLPKSPLPENQVLNVFSLDQLDDAIPGFC